MKTYTRKYMSQRLSNKVHNILYEFGDYDDKIVLESNIGYHFIEFDSLKELDDLIEQLKWIKKKGTLK